MTLVILFLFSLTFACFAKTRRFSNWQTIIVPGICTFQIPPTMEIQDGEYKQFMENYYKTYSNRSYAGVVVAQQKGLNNFNKIASKHYARVIAECIPAANGNGPKLGTKLVLPKTFFNDYDRIMQQRLESEKRDSLAAGAIFNVIALWPSKVVNINGVDCLLTVYKRSINNAAPAIVHVYNFLNYDCTHFIQISYRTTESQLWQKDLDAIIYTFEFVKR